MYIVIQNNKLDTSDWTFSYWWLVIGLVLLLILLFWDKIEAVYKTWEIERDNKKKRPRSKT